MVLQGRKMQKPGTPRLADRKVKIGRFYMRYKFKLVLPCIFEALWPATGIEYMTRHPNHWHHPGLQNVFDFPDRNPIQGFKEKPPG